MNDLDKTLFNSYLPIQLDASCNGYQHLALLTKETKLFDKLNLDESTFDDTPKDFYKYIIEKTNKYVNNQIDILSNTVNLNETVSKLLSRLKVIEKIKFERSIVKTMMTKSYNAFIIKQVDNIIKNLKEYSDVVIINNKPVNKKYYIYIDLDVKIRRQYILTFVMCLKHVLNEESPKIKELSSYLNNLVKICTRLQMPIPWNLPSGAFIKESYLIFKEVPIKAFTFLKTRYTFRTFIKGVYD
jgi:DNA-directed RNA polymerase